MPRVFYYGMLIAWIALVLGYAGLAVRLKSRLKHLRGGELPDLVNPFSRRSFQFLLLSDEHRRLGDPEVSRTILAMRGVVAAVLAGWVIVSVAGFLIG